MVRVLLDATAVPTDRGGVGRYVDNLVPALAGRGVELTVVCQPQETEHYSGLSGRPAVAAPPVSRRPATRLLWEQTGLPRVIAEVAPDVVHGPHYTHAVAARRPLVITLHDAIFFTDPQVHTATKGPFFRTAIRLALRRAACCIVPSQSTADQLVRVAGADPSRLQIAYYGVDTELFTPPDPAAVTALRHRLGLPDDQPYLGFLGTLEPRKNVPVLIRAWVRLCAGSANPPALVLAGSTGWDEQVSAAVADVPAGLRLIRAGYLPQVDLPAFLGGAAVVAYPSLAEGFGLPVLEAMACGAPVLTTRRTSLPEVGGDAVAYCEPEVESVAAALGELLADPDRRAELSAAGPKRAADFTWDACAAAHVLAYERAAGVR